MVTIGPKSTKGDTYHTDLRRQALRMSHSHEPLFSGNPLLTKSVHTVLCSHQMPRKIFSQCKGLFKANYLHNSKKDWVLREGNVFTGVCVSRGWVSPFPCPFWGSGYLWSQVSTGGVCPGVGVYVQGLGMSGGAGTHPHGYVQWAGTYPLADLLAATTHMVSKRAVCILLEYFLVVTTSALYYFDIYFM